MLPDPLSEPDQSIIYVGQDVAGHWLVQDNARRLEGRFVSFAAAMSYARAERDIHHAEVAVVQAPLVPVVPFLPVGACEYALSHAR